MTAISGMAFAAHLWAPEVLSSDLKLRQPLVSLSVLIDSYDAAYEFNSMVLGHRVASIGEMFQK